MGWTNAGGWSGRGWGRAAASGASWSPSTSTGSLITWVKADANVYSDAGTTPATNGVKVQQWNDQSSHAQNFTQPTSAFQWTYNTGILNGLPGLTGSNAASTFMVNSQTCTQSFMLFILLKTDANLVANNGYEMLVQDNTTGSRAACWINRNDNSKISAYAGTATVGAVAAANSTGYYLCFVYNGASSEIWVNGTQYLPGDIGSAAIANGFVLGSAGSEATNSTLIEVFAVSGTNSTDKSGGISYLKTRGGL